MCVRLKAVQHRGTAVRRPDTSVAWSVEEWKLAALRVLATQSGYLHIFEPGGRSSLACMGTGTGKGILVRVIVSHLLHGGKTEHCGVGDSCLGV